MKKKEDLHKQTFVSSDVRHDVLSLYSCPVVKNRVTTPPNINIKIPRSEIEGRGKNHLLQTRMTNVFFVELRRGQTREGSVGERKRI